MSTERQAPFILNLVEPEPGKSTFVQPSGMWLASLISDNSAGQVNVPVAATLVSQLPVGLFPPVQDVNYTAIELRL